jgi:mono/diheme cytochrome c family protein
VLVLFAMGFYLGRYGGSFSAEAHELYQKTGAARAEAAPPAPEGDFIYSAICAPCHQASGLGVSGQYPPLAGSEWVLGGAEIPARIVLNGLQGAVVVKGQTYRNEMPALGGQLSDAEIAAVLTYVRSSWGNQAAPVSEDVVKKARAAGSGQGAWTAEKLKALEAAR